MAQGLPVEDSLKLASVMDLQYPEISVVLVVRRNIRSRHQGHAVRSPGPPATRLPMRMPSASCWNGPAWRLPAVVGAWPRGLRSTQTMAKADASSQLCPQRAAWARRRSRQTLLSALAKAAPMGVVIVDLDLQFGDVASGLHARARTHYYGRSGGSSQPGLHGPEDLPHRPSGRDLRPLRAPQSSGDGQDHG